MAVPEGVLSALVSHETRREAALVAEVADAHKTGSARISRLVTALPDTCGVDAAAVLGAREAFYTDPEGILAALGAGNSLREAALVADVADT